MMSGMRTLKLHLDQRIPTRWDARAVMAGQPTDISVPVADGSLAASLLGTGKPVLLLHGWTFDRNMWVEQHALAESYQLVMPDRRGFGQSSAPPRLDEEYKDIDRLMPEGEFAIVGFSQGAIVAMDYAKRNPERVGALILVGAPLHNVVGSDPVGTVPVDAYRDWINSGDLAGMKRDWLKHRLMATDRDIDLDTMLADYSGRDLIEDDSEIELTADDIKNLSMPVLSVTGAADTAWRCAVTKYIGDNARAGRSHIIADAGHLSVLEQPAEFNRLADNFLHSHF